jgi:uncharacterized low-complexity protein
MNTSNKTIALALSGAFALSIAATTVNAAENPFAIKSLSSGYQLQSITKKVQTANAAKVNAAPRKKK